MSSSLEEGASSEVECHAYLPQFELQDLCKKLKIALTAYSPIGAPGQQRDKEYQLISNPDLQPLCEKYGKSPAQKILFSLFPVRRISFPSVQLLDQKVGKEFKEK
ncbi:alcohol dehydrogenase A [Trichonephila clavipes]|nr:alcohol dehydrogenase A [Trichonephila clavipes]